MVNDIFVSPVLMNTINTVVADAEKNRFRKPGPPVEMVKPRWYDENAIGIKPRELELVYAHGKILKTDSYKFGYQKTNYPIEDFKFHDFSFRGSSIPTTEHSLASLAYKETAQMHEYWKELIQRYPDTDGLTGI